MLPIGIQYQFFPGTIHRSLYADTNFRWARQRSHCYCFKKRPPLRFVDRLERSGVDLGMDNVIGEMSVDLRPDMMDRSPVDDYEASSLLSYSHSELSFADSHSATKPWFIRKLPSRLEIIEGRSFSILCRTSGAGCQPWFVKRLPARVEVERGLQINMDCTVSNVTEESLEAGARSTSWILEQKTKTGVLGSCLYSALINMTTTTTIINIS